MPVFEAERSELTRPFYSPRGMSVDISRTEIGLESLKPASLEIIGGAKILEAAILEVRGGIWYYQSHAVYERTGLEGVYVIPPQNAENRRSNQYIVFSNEEAEIMERGPDSNTHN